MHGTRAILLFTLLLLLSPAWAVDDDKARLFNTFYLDGTSITYVLILREDKTFELYAPDGARTSGSVRASTEHVTLISGDVKRFFHFDNRDADLKLGRRDTDKLVKGHLLGTMPPTTDARALFVSEENWRRKGNPVLTIGPATPRVLLPRPAATAPEGPLSAPADFRDLAGGYNAGEGKLIELLTLFNDGRFDYVAADGTRAKGTVLRVDDELTFVGTGHRRHLSFKATASGLEFKRRATDTLKTSDPLGRMAPQAKTVFWYRDAPLAPVAPVATPVEPRVATVEPPRNTPPTTVQPVTPIERPLPIEPRVEPRAAGVAVQEIHAAIGTYVHKPNPFISETLAITADGAFSYKDSNASAAAGIVTFEQDVMVLTSGEVIRRLRASMEGNTLILAVDKSDAPKFKNDLATMSPTVLKTAKYEKK